MATRWRSIRLPEASYNQLAREAKRRGVEPDKLADELLRATLGGTASDRETALAGLAWALWQPWRLTLLHPHGQGFWWLVAEPPLYVVLVGVLFRLLIAPGLVKDLEESR